MQQYVLGFMFNDLDEVLLIRKERPEWQKGNLNGIGGKVEHLERPDDAMVREFFEECGIQTSRETWKQKILMKGHDFKIHVYTARGEIRHAVSKTDEWVDTYSLLGLPPNVIPNLKWQIPILLDDGIKNVVMVDYAD